MKVSIGTNVKDGPWGGGNLFAINLTNYLKEYNHEVVYNLDEEERKKHSSYFNFDSLKNEFDFNLKYISNITDEENLQFLKNMI